MRAGVYPGSFNPPTVAHLAIAEAAVEQCQLDRLDLVISTETLGKSATDLHPLAARLAALERAATTRRWLRPQTSNRRLLADIAEGYDLLVLGADKWAQVIDPTWYSGSEAERDRALARLPPVAVAPRVGFTLPVDGAFGVRLTILDLHEDHHGVSASAVREGETGWLAPEAIEIFYPSQD